MDYTLTFPEPIFDSLQNIKHQSYKHHPLYLTIPEYLDDFSHSKEFLLSYNGSEATFNSYRREIERFLQWCWLIKQCPVKDINRQDFEAYLSFCQSPPKDWIAKKTTPRFLDIGGERVPNKEWRPFVVEGSKRKYFVSQAALKSIFAIISSFYQYLIEVEYTDTNPVNQIRQKSKYIRKQQSKQPVRRLSELQWNYVIETAEQMADQDQTHERLLFMMSCLYGMYLRISELTASERWVPLMNHFYVDQEGNWWFKTVGKGNKERDIAVSNAILKALKRYRKSLGLTPLPSPADTSYLFTSNRGGGPLTSTRYIRNLVDACYKEASSRLKNDGFDEEADNLTSATVHWLRHTGISDDVKHRPREHVRDDAGHSSSAITDRYVDSDLKERHASARKKLIKEI